MILLKTLHPNRWFLYFMAIAFVILLVVYYTAQIYLIETDNQYLEQPIGITNTPPAQNAGDVVDTTGWKTYRNEEFGFEFRYSVRFLRYPGGESNSVRVFANKSVTSIRDVGIEEGGVYVYPSSSHFSWFILDGYIDYDSIRKVWKRTPGLNATLEDARCPDEGRTKTQNIPYYHIGDGRSGRSQSYAYVTTKGVVVLHEPYPFEIHDNLMFHNPEDVLTIGCD